MGAPGVVFYVLSWMERKLMDKVYGGQGGGVGCKVHMEGDLGGKGRNG